QLVFAEVLVHVVPLGAVNQRLEKSLAVWLHDDVSSGGLRVSLFPRPHVNIENLSLGKVLDAKATSGKLYMDLATLFGDRFVIDTLELTDVSIAAEALPRALKWADTEGRGKGIEIGKIVLRGVKANVNGVALDEFDAELKLDKAGKIVQASARAKDGKWNVDVVPNKPTADAVAGTGVNDPWAIEFSARGMNLPWGTPLPVTSLNAKGTMFDEGMVFPQFDAKLFDGSASGNLKISWKQGVSFNGEIAVEKLKVDQLTQVFTRDISLSGKLDGKFAASAQAATVGALLDKPNIQGNFEVKDGTVGNVDLVQVMRSPGSVGGQSKFSDLTGQLRIADGVIHYEKMKLTGGVLLANGNINVVLATSALSGGVSSEIRSSVAQDRASFSVGGKVSRPALRRGG
ncbi:MAG: AsmA-like C-terminal region-containing protein, partial [Burkholderiales bacterium]|nr:AsmA-like C-terminal region-containing protein [Burkholderiales bacterium]